MNTGYLKEVAEGVQISVKLQPRASRQQICGVHGDELKIAVTAPPVDAAANRALIELVAELLRVPRSSIALIRGQTSRHKTLLVRAMTIDAVLERLKPHLE